MYFFLIDVYAPWLCSSQRTMADSSLFTMLVLQEWMQAVKLSCMLLYPPSPLACL